MDALQCFFKKNLFYCQSLACMALKLELCMKNPFCLIAAAHQHYRMSWNSISHINLSSPQKVVSSFSITGITLAFYSIVLYCVSYYHFGVALWCLFSSTILVLVLYLFLSSTLAQISRIGSIFLTKHIEIDFNFFFGRSNVVTEDISKLFVRRHRDPWSH